MPITPPKRCPRHLVLDDLGHPVLDQPGLVGVAQVVKVHAELDRRVTPSFIAGQGGQPDPAAEVRAPVQATVGAGEHEPGACVVMA